MHTEGIDPIQSIIVLLSLIPCVELSSTKLVNEIGTLLVYLPLHGHLQMPR